VAGLERATCRDGIQGKEADSTELTAATALRLDHSPSAKKGTIAPICSMRHMHKRKGGTAAAHNDALGNRGYAALPELNSGELHLFKRAHGARICAARVPLIPLFPLFSFLQRIRAQANAARAAPSHTKRISLRLQSDKRHCGANSSSSSILKANARVRCRADKCAAPPEERNLFV
jgi:hypothetical protein